MKFIFKPLQISFFIVILLIDILLSTSLYANNHFKNLNIQNGLTHTDANCVAQDSTGFIWVGTNAGLQYFDGYQLHTINFYPANQKIYESHNRINAIECSRNRLWIGTESGLTCLDLNTHLYIPYTVVANDPTILNQHIRNLTIDNINQRLWIYTIDRRLCVVQIEEATNTLYIIEWDSDYNKQLIWDYYKPIIHKGYLWTTTNGTLAQLTIENSKVHIENSYRIEELLNQDTAISALYATSKCLYLRSEEGCFRFPFTNRAIIVPSEQSYICFHQINPEISRSSYGHLVVEEDETLWCSYFGGVFEVKNAFTSNCVINQYLENNPNVNLSFIRINSLFIDDFKNLWVSTGSRGLYYRSLSSTPFHYISTSKFRAAGFATSEISSIAVEKNKAMWMIIEEGSLFHYDTIKDKWELISLPASKGAVNRLQTLSLSTDQQKLYIGLAEGLIVYNIKDKTSRWLIGGQSRIIPHSISIYRIKEDKWGRLWICSWGKGVYCIKDINSTPSIIYHLTPWGQQPIISNFITDLYIDDSTLLLGTTHGLNRIWLDEYGAIHNISTYQANDSISESMSSNYIACIDQQNDSIYWVGTIGGGVNRIIIHSTHDNDYSAVCYTEHDGLTSNDSEIIYLDENQDVWVGGKGIARIRTELNHIYVYDSQNNFFKIGSGCKSEDGTIYMGSISGLCYFQPKELDGSLHSIPIHLRLNNLYINNKQVLSQVEYDGQIILSKILNQTKHIDLTYKQNDFSISFSALDYSPYSQIIFRYRMKGYEKEWQIISHSLNRAYYSNLPYGDYLFELQVSTDRGISWNIPERTIEIAILAPWWLTIWAKILYVFVFLSISIIIIYQYHKEQKLKRENHIKEIERINEEERYQSKMHFFMNVSHELKTPLTLIMLSAEKLMETVRNSSVSTIWNNSKKMLLLISELMDIRKADLGINKLLWTHQNIVTLVHQFYLEIKPWATKKEIEIIYISEVSELKMDFDWNKIGKLIINLLSNAIKYTPQGGQIKIMLKKMAPKDIVPLYSTKYQEGEIQPDEPACILIVQDTGVGISPESIRYIYERFFQVNSTTQSHLGTGIGLAIAKTMVLLHNGSIIVSSERAIGTEFIVALPIHDNLSSVSKQEGSFVFDAREFIENQYSEYTPLEEETIVNIEHNNHNSNLPVLLIVEDNKDMQNLLKERLYPHYQIYIANNGKEGLDICKSIFPDIIISDIMMPDMDGIEMCRQIRNDLSIAYIPIILLTAKGNVENQIEGYESGADLYIPKPFSIKLLQVNLIRLLNLKERLLKEEVKMTEGTDEIETLAEKDDRNAWQCELEQLIKDNISDTDLSVEFLCEKLFMSRSQLYKKMKECNHQPLADYIRNIRLTMAAELLLNSSYTINEIVMDVGFVNTSHFSKIFKIKYGVNPSEYKKHKRAGN